MLGPLRRESLYANTARFTGLLLVITCVAFQRRGLMDWTEIAFLGACVVLQEGYMRGSRLKHWRVAVLFVYSVLPLVLTVYHANEIGHHATNFVNVILLTPLPLVLTSVQIMVLYVRESARLVSVVLVLCLFSVVIGLRREVHDTAWAWVLAISAMSALYLLLQYPSLLFQGIYRSRKPGPVSPSGHPGGIMRGLFAAVVPVIVAAVLVSSLSLYFFLPRVNINSEPDQLTAIALNQTDRDDRSGSRRDRNGGRNERKDNGGVSGMSDGMDLGDFGRIKLDESGVMTVVELSLRENPPPLYLRTFTFAEFDGETWHPLKDSGKYVEHIPYGNQRPIPDYHPDAVLSNRVNQYFISPKKGGVGLDGQLPLPVHSVSISQFKGELYYDTMQGTLIAPGNKPPAEYVANARQPEISPKKLAKILRRRGHGTGYHLAYKRVDPELLAAIESRFGLFEEYKEVARERGSHAVCLALISMFRDLKELNSDKKAWTYSLENRPAWGKDAIARFLDTTVAGERFGHCEYFATAMAILLRAYGIPARVVSGLVGHKQVGEGKWELKGKDAHAWIEVYYGGAGWITYDPTPPEGESTEEAFSQPEEDEATTPEAPVLEEETEDDPENEPEPLVDSGDWFNDYDQDSQDRMFGSINSWFYNISDRFGGVAGDALAWMPLDANPFLKLVLFFTPIGLILLMVGLLRRRKKKLVRQVLEEMGITVSSQRQHGLYVDLLLLLSKHGYKKHRSETPREFARRVAKAGGEVHLPIVELTELYYGFRFGASVSAENEFKQSLSSYATTLRSLAT